MKSKETATAILGYKQGLSFDLSSGHPELDSQKESYGQDLCEGYSLIIKVSFKTNAEWKASKKTF